MCTTIYIRVHPPGFNPTNVAKNFSILQTIKTKIFASVAIFIRPKIYVFLCF